jgi:hypothetical protein
MREVHSGDDLILLVDLGVDSLYKMVRVRLSGVDTPDAHKASPSSAAGRVRDSVKQMLHRKTCRIHVLSQNRGSWLVVLEIVKDGGSTVNLNELLINQGFVFKKVKE